MFLKQKTERIRAWIHSMVQYLMLKAHKRSIIQAFVQSKADLGFTPTKYSNYHFKTFIINYIAKIVHVSLCISNENVRCRNKRTQVGLVLKVVNEAIPLYNQGNVSRHHLPKVLWMNFVSIIELSRFTAVEHFIVIFWMHLTRFFRDLHSHASGSLPSHTNTVNIFYIMEGHKSKDREHLMLPPIRMPFWVMHCRTNRLETIDCLTNPNSPP